MRAIDHSERLIEDHSRLLLDNGLSSGDTIANSQEIKYGVLASGKLWEGGRDLNSETFR